MQFCQHKAMTTSSLKTLNTLYFCFARCTSQIEALTSPPWAYPGHLTLLPAQEGGHLITTRRGWGI